MRASRGTACVRRQERHVCYRQSTMIDTCLPTDECCPPVAEAPLPVPGSAEEEAELAVIAKALGHPMRVRILRILLARRACHCGELVAELPISQATVSQHLKMLKEAGLVQGEIDGPRVCYCANTERLERLSVLLGSLRQSERIEKTKVMRA
jgi:ArsR family transcriptional regulator